jgi:hypothetical protein
MAGNGKKVEAVAYIRTSSAANVGADKDSDKRQRAEHPYQAVYAKDQRQGRALHPDVATRMGLCPRLQHLTPTRRPTAKMAAPLQLAPASRFSDRLAD